MKGYFKFISPCSSPVLQLSISILFLLIAMETGMARAQETGEVKAETGAAATAGASAETSAAATEGASAEADAAATTGAPAETSAAATAGASAENIPSAGSTPAQPPPAKTQGNGAEKTKMSSTEVLSGTLPPRKTFVGAFLMLGHVAPSGFLLGADISIGWNLIRFLSLHLRVGAGGVVKRGGGVNTLVHGDIMLPVRLAICSHSPRVCPGLDFYVSIVPGIGYGLLMQNKTSDTPFRLLNHAINAIIGLSLESIRTYGNMDAGVRFGVYIYIDFLKESEEEDPWLAYALFELGIIVRWGKKG